MPKSKIPIPDAWEDDWETAADREEPEPEPAPEPQKPITKKQLLAKHEEENKKIWDAAQAPSEPFHFLSIQEPPPLATPSATYFKPAVKVLSRTPGASRTPVLLGGGGGGDDDDDDDDDDDGNGKAKPTSEELRRRQEKEREEKQRRYDEARARIFGEASQQQQSQQPQQLQFQSQSTGGYGRGRGRGRGGRGGRAGAGGFQGNSGRYSPGAQGQQAQNYKSPPIKDTTARGTATATYIYADSSEPRQRPNSQASSSRVLYDPNAATTSRPSSVAMQLHGSTDSNQSSGGAVLIRQPRDPDGTRGFNFGRNKGRGRADA